ncbi:hypothetical protein ASESINO_233 [Erwinia phage vB_EamM_Asesino]|uniref:Uncharacterized protein n=1 Tax=Erwinia phage vB_EamM_Asesino TaxID=1883370 RepID=A0A1B2IAH7_9CAUD|nr:hypothetical protein ASESINO_233 [Erwinia phage vB_EamM_Asesino]ANZ48246.1 hypothetical protein ASESINO_233 [Erwinia phage vB_EamM_Asesino]
MKIYFNLTDDKLREIWPKAMNGLRDQTHELVKAHMGPELVYYSMTITNTVLGELYWRVGELSRTIGTFEYDSSDLTDGNMEKNISRFTMELKVDEVIDEIGKHFNDKAAREKWLNEQHSEDRSVEALRTFKWDEFYPAYISAVTNTLRELEEEVWKSITETINTLVIHIEKK